MTPHGHRSSRLLSSSYFAVSFEFFTIHHNFKLLNTTKKKPSENIKRKYINIISNIIYAHILLISRGFTTLSHSCQNMKNTNYYIYY